MSQPVSDHLSQATTELRVLLQRMARQDPAALAELYDSTSSIVFGVALRMLNSRPDAEEVTLDVYLRIWKNAARYEADRGCVLGLLLRITRNLAIDLLRYQASRRASHPVAPEIFDAMAGDLPTPEQSTLVAQYVARLREALARLPPEQREFLELAYFSGLSHSEIAEHLSQPLGTVKGRIRAALAKLRAELEDLR